MNDSSAQYGRVLLKLSGEALMGDLEYGIEPKVIQRIAAEIAAANKQGIEIAIVIGGGNIFRGAGLAQCRHGPGYGRLHGHARDRDERARNPGCARGARRLPRESCPRCRYNEVCEDYIRRRAVRHLEKGRVVILAAGTGNPFFTTDTAASLRAIEIGADVLLKGNQGRRRL